MLAAAFGQRVAEPPPGPDLAEEPLAGGVRSPHREHVDQQVVPLRHLGQRGIDRGEDPGDLGQGRRPEPGPAELGGHGDLEQA
jgi:hypothetical protein